MRHLVLSLCLVWVASCASTSPPSTSEKNGAVRAQPIEPCAFGIGEDQSIHRIVKPSGPWVDGEMIVVEGSFQKGTVWCTELLCPKSDPCCNGCGGEGRLRQFAPMRFRGLGECSGDSCGVSCSVPDETRLKVWGSVQSASGERVFGVEGACVLDAQ